MKKLILLLFFIPFLSCDYDKADTFDSRIIGHWETKVSVPNFRSIRYEFESQFDGKIIYYSDNIGEIFPNVPFNDTIILKEIRFTKGNELRLISIDGSKYNHVIELKDDLLLIYTYGAVQTYYQIN